METQRREKEQTGGEKEGKRQMRSTKGKRQKERGRQERQKTEIWGGEEIKKGIYRGETKVTKGRDRGSDRGKRK